MALVEIDVDTAQAEALARIAEKLGVSIDEALAVLIREHHGQGTGVDKLDTPPIA